MQVRDRSLLRLADEATRAAQFDQLALAQIVAGAYDVAGAAIDGPYTPVFDEFRLGVVEGSAQRGHGTLLDPAGATTRFDLHLEDPRRDALVECDALWRGSIVARASPSSSTIEDVSVRWPRTPELEATEHLAEAGVRFSAAAAAAPRAIALPVTVWLLVRDADLGLAALLSESRRLRRRLDPAEYAAPRPRDLPQRHPMLVAWLVPGALFDDDDWPGATPGMTPVARRAARRQRAGHWLAREGIGLAVMPD